MKKRLFPGLFINSSGFSLIEVAIMLSVISFVLVGVVLTFSKVGIGFVLTKKRTIANNLAQEKVEYLKSKSYNRLLVTPESDLLYYGYDNTNDDYKPEVITVAGLNYTRYTAVWKGREENVGGKLVISTMSASSSEEGIKKIKTVVKWFDNHKEFSITLFNYREDPNRQTRTGNVYGIVTTTGVHAAIEGATVEIVQNLNLNAVTSATGYYIIKTTTPAMFQVRAFKNGYFPTTSVNKAVHINQNMDLAQKLTGTVTGWAVIDDHLLISLVASATDYKGFEQEYVQLYNPTTWQFTINSATIKLYYVYSSNTVYEIPLTFIDTNLFSYGYYLIANTTTVRIGGTSVSANARYSGDVIQEGTPGGIGLCDNYDVWIDSVSWGKTAGLGADPPSQAVETEGYKDVSGPIGSGKQLYRLHYVDSSYGLTSGTIRGGGAYDSNNNLADFYYGSIPTSGSPPYNNSASSPPVSGTPAYGAVISADDGLCSSTTAYLKQVSVSPYRYNAYFSIAVTTGVCGVFISSGNFFRSVSSVTVNAGQYASILTNNTSPKRISAGRDSVVLSSPIAGGLILGRVLNWNTFVPISGIQVSAGASPPTYTDSSGRYSFVVDEGSYTVTANKNYFSASWTDDSETAEAVQSQTTEIRDLLIYPAGWISGVTKNASLSPLPYITIRSTMPMHGFSKEGFSDINGSYIIKGVRTGQCYVSSVVDEADTYIAAKSYPITIAQGVENTGNNFTITSAWGKLKGVVRDNGNNITTGVLIVATTGAVPSDPPQTINHAFRAGNAIYYGTVSISDGTYEVLVRKGWAYNIRAWYTKLSLTGVTTTSKPAASGVVNDTTSPITVNISWP